MPERVDRRSRIRTKSWGEVWAYEGIREGQAKTKALALINLNPDEYDGVAREEKPGKGIRGKVEISVVLGPKEIDSAPVAMRRIFNDLGITSGDNVTVGIDTPAFKGSSFRFLVRPENITDETLGLELGFDPRNSFIVAPLTKPDGTRFVGEYRLGWHKEITMIEAGTHPAEKGQVAKRIYAGISGQVDGNEMYGRYHPYLIEIMETAANWMTELINARKKSKVVATNDKALEILAGIPQAVFDRTQDAVLSGDREQIRNAFVENAKERASKRARHHRA
ncbi:MAG: hypothetical protein A3B38_01035 [Candidatus Levybacteria bacterium RIFCSPLOWO2_01_FULL_36_13]|nr:MAG: hypothetical protein A2684_02275 [Candidatus Levybacteria bacterium RIFCSPHIGHO2_01_FULL_36_15b]OGH35471.1 MAG: hypothetical protein A3B38_01035 [Candidatus Levybacteria bacterium RIFCSPLOWO2_01_FULL_36_13]